MSFVEIIEKVKAHPELWQSSHPFYRHRVVGARTWKKIAAELRADDWNLLKKKWKHLKDTFRKELKKVTAKQIPMSPWRHYNALQFLADEVIKKHKKQESEASETESESERKPLKPKILRKRMRLATTPVDTTSQSLVKCKKIMRCLNNLAKSLDKSSNFLDDDLKNDTDYMFLVSLLPTMKNLSDIQRLHFRGKINDWLLTALTENEFIVECDTKAYVQINHSNVQDCKVEVEDNL